MTIPYMATGVIWSVIKHVIGIPIINKALDHWAAGTSNKVDDWVWYFLEMMAGIPDAQRPTAIAEGIAKLQKRYDDAKKNGSLVELKTTVKTWDTAMLMPKTFPSANVG